MEGFGKGFELKKYSGKLYHSCTIEGLSDLLFDYNGENVCFSTDASTKLFGRECVIVLSVENIEGLYTPYDADAGKNYGWDEFRCSFQVNMEFFAGKALFDAMDRVVMSADAIDRLRTDEETGELEELVGMISETSPDGESHFWNVEF